MAALQAPKSPEITSVISPGRFSILAMSLTCAVLTMASAATMLVTSPLTSKKPYASSFMSIPKRLMGYIANRLGKGSTRRLTGRL